MVYYPLKRAQICTVEKARAVILALIPLAMVTFSPVLWMHGMSCGYCDLERAYDSWGQALNVVDTVLSAVFPSLLVIVLNTLIVSKLYRSRDVPGSSGSGRGDKGFTKMLLIISSSFVILNVPSYAIRLKVLMTRVLNMPQLWTPLDQDLEYIFYMMFLLNFSIDFVMYNLSSRHFRQLAGEYFGQMLFRLLPCLDRNPFASVGQTVLTRVPSRLPSSQKPSCLQTRPVPSAPVLLVESEQSSRKSSTASCPPLDATPRCSSSHTIITRL